jgi:hypothetical protein
VCGSRRREEATAIGYYQIIHVLLPNQRQRRFQLTEIKEIIPGKGAIPRKARQQKSDAKVPNEKLNMKVTLEPLSGTASEIGHNEHI